MAIHCPSRKRPFPTEAIAEEALIEARTQYGDDKSGPVGVYRCEDCGAYHLTSKGVMNPRLAQYIRDGKLKLNQEANRWKRKMN